MSLISDAVTPGIMAGTIGVAGGVTARALKHFLQTTKGQDETGPRPPKPLAIPVARLPVEVSPDEAQELERQGVQVKVANLTAGLAMGATGTLGALGGWKVLSTYLDRAKIDAAKQRRDTQRQRVESLLDSQVTDALDHHANDTAKLAVAHVLKTAGGFLDHLTTGVDNLTTGGGMLVGGAATLAGIAAFRSAQKNKQHDIIGALNKAHENQAPLTPQVQLAPVLHRRKDGPSQEATQEVSTPDGDMIKTSSLRCTC